MKNKLSQITVFAITFCSLFWGAFQLNTTIKNKESLVNWDGYGYYLHLPSLLIYGDVQDYKKVHANAQKHQIETSYQTRALNDTTHYPVYPVGQALTWFPFFGAAHIIAHLSIYPTDGFSAPYQAAILLSSVLFIFIGFYFNRKLLLHFVSDKITALSMLLIFIGTNYLYYSHYEISITHVYLYGYLSIFLYSIYLYYITGQKKYFWAMAISFGVAILTRNSEIFWIIIPALVGVRIDSFFTRKIIFSRAKLVLYLLVVAFSSYVIFQMTYYKISTQQWFVNGYGDHTFNFFDPNIYNCLFGFYKGWFVYTPLAILFVLGFYFLYKKNKDWFIAILIFFILYLYLLLSWDDWTYGSTFSFRPIVQSYAILIVPLAFCLSYLLKKVKWFTIILLSGIVFLNIFQTLQYTTGILLRENYSFNYYKQVFLKLKSDKHDRIIIDIPSHRKQLVDIKSKQLFSQVNLSILPTLKDSAYPIYTHNLDQDTRLQTTIDFSYYGDSYNSWNQPRFITYTKPSSDNAYWSGLRLPEIMRNKKRDTIVFNQLIPKIKGDSIYCIISNQILDSIEIHKLTIDKID